MITYVSEDNCYVDSDVINQKVDFHLLHFHDMSYKGRTLYNYTSLSGFYSNVYLCLLAKVLQAKTFLYPTHSKMHRLSNRQLSKMCIHDYVPFSRECDDTCFTNAQNCSCQIIPRILT